MEERQTEKKKDRKREKKEPKDLHGVSTVKRVL